MGLKANLAILEEIKDIGLLPLPEIEPKLSCL
jgi:hypothetical protein